MKPFLILFLYLLTQGQAMALEPNRGLQKVFDFLGVKYKIGASLLPNNEVNRAISSVSDQRKSTSGIVDSTEGMDLEVLPEASKIDAPSLK